MYRPVKIKFISMRIMIDKPYLPNENAVITNPNRIEINIILWKFMIRAKQQNVNYSLFVTCFIRLQYKQTRISKL